MAYAHCKLQTLDTSDWEEKILAVTLTHTHTHTHTPFSPLSQCVSFYNCVSLHLSLSFHLPLSLHASLSLAALSVCELICSSPYVKPVTQADS